MLERLKRVVRCRNRSTGFVECRRCGSTLDRPTGRCPTCNSEEIACYQL